MKEPSDYRILYIDKLDRPAGSAIEVESQRQSIKMNAREMRRVDWQQRSRERRREGCLD